MPCPDHETLSMYLDGELDQTARQNFEDHLASCRRCEQILRRGEAVQRTLGEVLMRRTPSLSERPGSACAHPAELSNYVNGLLTAEEQQAIEEHLRQCDRCLVEVLALHRTLRALRKDQWLSPPESLVERARHAIVSGGQAPGISLVARVVIQVARRGLKVLDLSGASPALNLHAVALPAPAQAFRGRPEDAQSGHVMEIQATMGALDLVIRLVHEHDETVGGTIRVRKAGQPLSHVRAILRKAGRTIYSRRLSQDGRMNLPRLIPGEYTLSIPQEGVETMVLLQASIAEE